MGSSHCSQNSVLSGDGAASSGVVTLIAVGGVVNGSGAAAAASEPSAELVVGSSPSELPHDTSTRASSAGTDMRAQRCQLFIGSP